MLFIAAAYNSNFITFWERGHESVYFDESSLKTNYCQGEADVRAVHINNVQAGSLQLHSDGQPNKSMPASYLLQRATTVLLIRL